MTADIAEVPSETWVAQVKDALEHLYDLTHLQRHALARDKVADSVTSSIAGQRLRTELVNAIETLNPGKGTPFRAPHARIYNLLTLHYVDKLTIREAANELGISPRQADRGLRQGEQSVAEVLWGRRSAHASAPEPSPVDAAATSSLQAEMARISVRPQLIDLTALIARCMDAVRPLAVQTGFRLHIEAPAERVVLSTDPVLAEQILLTLLSRALTQAEVTDPRLSLEANDSQITLTLWYGVASDTVRLIDPVVSELANRLRWLLSERDRADGVHCVSLQMAACGPLVLVIDDNEGLVSLLQRYLTDQTCRVVAATSGEEGLRLAQQLRPAAIVLDVMMPVMHGWEVLQRLRAHQQTTDIPVIICSVFNNPELAQALGATLFLPKPIRQEEILAALARLSVV